MRARQNLVVSNSELLTDKKPFVRANLTDVGVSDRCQMSMSVSFRQVDSLLPLYLEFRFNSQ